ncbi:MAG: type II secretion system protein [Nitrospiraceae bacterium]|nr:MAG: type II secretion system protein [Nitrospiraceae bacterium]
MTKIWYKNHGSSGFTLIELAIVLVIVGLLIGMGSGLVGTLTKRAKLYENRNIIDAAVESLISYSASNNELPDISTFPTVVRNPNDVWKKQLYYIADDDLLDTTAGGICDRRTTQLKLANCPDTACGTPTNTIDNVAFIILSGSANFNNQTGIPATNPVTSATTVNHYSQGLTLDDYTTDMNRAEPYDDIVRWITLDELRIKAGCKGAPLNIVNNELPYGYQDSTYNATIFANGGVPYTSGGGKYRWCRQESASTGLTFTPDVSSLDCLALAEASWNPQADSTLISGTAGATGSFRITFFVRDDNDSGVLAPDDNIAQKTFVITVNPAPTASGGCADYRVWNATGSTFDFDVDGTCKTLANGLEITTPQMLNAGEDIERRASTDGGCTGQNRKLSYNEAVAADFDGDCCVNSLGETGTDRACP